MGRMQIWSRLMDRSDTQYLSRVDVFQRTMLGVSLIAGVTHLAFLILFASLGLPYMAWANVLSIVCYATTALTLPTWPLASCGLMFAEILLHGTWAIHQLGWESGFHYYIILIIPVATVIDLPSVILKWVVVLGSAVAYLLMDAHWRDLQGVHVVAPAALHALHSFNLAGTLFILTVLAFVYSRLVNQAESVLRYQACTDPLTRLSNRRYVLEMARREAAVMRRDGRPLSVLLCDVDHFKRVNDRHGHQAGDDVLRAVAASLQSGLRNIDHVARWGGEEFLIVLPATHVDEAQAVAERLRSQVAAQVCTSGQQVIPVTMTVGVTEMRAAESIEAVIARADAALYRGKIAGRNRVEVGVEA